MGIFKRKTKEVEEKQEFERNEKRYILPYSKNFRGFKRFAFVVFGDETSEQNNKQLLNNDFSNCTFEFVCFNCETKYFKGRMTNIFIDGLKIGAIFENEQISDIENGQIEKIHVEKDINRERLTLFVKYKE